MNQNRGNFYASRKCSEQAYENPLPMQTTLTSNENGKADKRPPNVPKTSENNQKISTASKLALLVVLTISALFSILSYVKSGATITTARNSHVYKSCLELKDAGFATSGIYTIQSVLGYDAYKVYCDMTSDGGGWTLVASVHEDNIQSRCSAKDQWSLTPSYYKLQGPQLWSNRKTTGKIEEATIDDFKSRAYFLPASDVLVSHVPNNVPAERFEKNSYLKYHTFGGFLKRYGSSLPTFYRDHAPLNNLNLLGLDKKVVSLIKRSDRISSLFPNWYNYKYDAGIESNRIIDGGDGAFNVGNKVYFSVGDEPYTLMNYGRSYTDSKTYHITSAATYPFVTMATITAGQNYLSKFRIKVESTVSAGSYKQVSVSSSHGKYKLYGRAQNIYYSGSTRPTICKFFFYIQGYLGFYSHSISFPYMYSRTNLNLEMQVSSNPQNAFLGYMLLSRKDGHYFNSSELQTVLEKVADNVDLVNPLELNNNPPNFTFPVKYLKGQVKFNDPKVTSGFLQLRPYDDHGASYAMCPGVKLSGNADPALYCIGSGNTRRYDSSRCGDFAAWDRLPEHYSINRDNITYINDISSTILIFTR